MGTKARRQESIENEVFIDALRLWMGKRPLYKQQRNEVCLDWFHRPIGDGNQRVGTRGGDKGGSIEVRLG